MHWLCCALVLLIGMTRELVICKHADGPSHFEFSHPEGDGDHHHGGCRHDHVHVAWTSYGDRDAGEEHGEPPAPCAHVHLSVDVGPEPEAAVTAAARAGAPLMLPDVAAPTWRTPVRRAPPPASATGPPKPKVSSHLTQRASVVLLI